MKKTLLLTFFIICYLGPINAQVGIGTPMPNASSQLEVVAADKGVLIPKISLTGSTDATTITNGNVNSLLVFNTATISDVKPGYYYWYDNKWNRLVISNETTAVPDTVIFNPTNQQFTYTDSSGVTQVIDFSQIVSANQTITTIVNNGSGSYTYKNEAGTDVTIDVVGDVTTNFSTIVNDPAVTTILQQISNNTEGNVTFDSTTNQFSYVDNSGNTQIVDINSIIKASETITTLTNNGSGFYTYKNEAETDATIDVVGDVINNASTILSSPNFVNELTNVIQSKETVTTQSQDLLSGAITYTNETGFAVVSQVRSADAGNILKVGSDGGVLLNPTAITAATTVSNTSAGNDLSTTVNGVAGTTVPIINSNATALTGTSLTTTVNGVSSTPLDLAPALAASTTNTLSLSGNTLTSNVNGITSTSDAVSAVSNASSVNTSTVTVNGVTSTGAPIINSNATSLTGTSLITTVNGVASTALDLAPAIASGETTTNLSQDTSTGVITYTNENADIQTAVLKSADAGNILAIGTDGGALLTPSGITVATTVSNASSANTSTVTVNGVTSTGAPIINSNAIALTGTSLTTTVNGVASTALDLAPALAAGTTNTLTALNGDLISTVNGVATPPVPIVISSDNGLTTANGNVQLGGSLLTSTTIITDPANTLAITGLQAGTVNDNIVVSGTSGVLKTISSTALNVNDWHLLGNSGTNESINFIGTTDDHDLVFKRDNNPAGLLNRNNTSFGVFALNIASTGTGNTAMGRYSLFSNTSGFYNTAMGENSLYNNTTGAENTASGHLALLDNTTGNFNTSSGYGSLSGNTSGNRNTAFGNGAGNNNTTASNNTFLGAGANLSASGLNVSNATAVGYNARVATSNSLVLGGSAADAVNVGIGIDTPTNTLHIKPLTGVNPIRIEGLQASVSGTDNIIVADATGILRTVTPNSLIPATTVSNTSIANSLNTTVNGITGTTVPIINSNATSLTGTSLTTTVNGVASTTLDLAPAIASGETTTNLLQDAATGVITYTNENADIQSAVLRSADADNILAIGTDGGALLTPSGITAATTVSNASSANTSTVTVNGVTSTGAPIINSNATSLTGTSLTTTVNGISSTALDLTPALAAGTTNTLSLSGNTLTSNVNGITSTSDAVSAVSNASSANTSTVTVNGVTSTGAPIINSNVLGTSGNTLTATINGVASNAIDLTSAIASGETTTNLSQDAATGAITYTNENADIQTAVLKSSDAGNILAIGTDGGALLTPSGITAATTVSNASSANTSTVTVNGVTSTGAPIINSNVLGTSGNTLTATINGVASNAIDLTSAIASGETTTNLSQDAATGVITYTNENADIQTAVLKSADTGNILAVGTDGGALLTPSGITAATTVSNASSANTSTVTVNGVTSTGAPIINSNVLGTSGNTLTATINGVASNAIDLTSAIASGETTTNLSQDAATGVITYTNENADIQTAVLKSADAGNILAVGTDGGALLTPSGITAATTVSNTSAGNDLSTTVNGVAGTTVPIINSNATSLTGTSLTTTVNGVASTALDLAPAIASGETTTNLSQNTATGVIIYTNENADIQTAVLKSADAGNILTLGTDGGTFLDDATIKNNETVTTILPIITAGNTIATYTNEAGGTPVNIKETETSLVYSSLANTITYNGEVGISTINLADISTTTPSTVLAVTGTGSTVTAATVDIVPSTVEGDVLTTTATGVAWKAPAKPNIMGIKITYDDYALTDDDYTIIAKSLTKDITITLPDATANTGRILIINQFNTLKSDGSPVVVNFNVPVAYSDAAVYPYIASSLSGGVTGGSVKITLQSDGTNWYVISYTM